MELRVVELGLITSPRSMNGDTRAEERRREPHLTLDPVASLRCDPVLQKGVSSRCELPREPALHFDPVVSLRCDPDLYVGGSS